MNSKTASKIAAFAMVALLAVMIPMPAVSAQTATLQLDKPKLDSTDPIKPDTGVRQVTIPWVYNIDAQGGQVVGVRQTSTTLTWTKTQCDNPNVVVTGPKTQIVTLVDSNGAPQNRDSGDGKFDITANLNAPGEQQIKCSFEAEVPELQSSVVPKASGSTDSTVSVDFLGLITASVPKTIQQAGPQKEISYDIEVTNLGNSLTDVVFSLGNDPSGGWNPVVPTKVTLQSTQQGGSEISKTVSFLVSTPFKNGWNNKDTTFQLSITPYSTKDVEKFGQAVTINVLARVRGVYVPSLEPMVMVGAVLGSALVARLMRGDEE